VNHRRGRVTASITKYLDDLYTIAQYWLKDKTRADSIIEIIESLGEPSPVYDKDSALVPLSALETAGLLVHPFHPEHMRRNRNTPSLYRHIMDPQHVPLSRYWQGRSVNGYGTQVQMSLILRLLIRLPMRQRCIREMKLGHNLKQLPDRSWEIHFQGDELKIGTRRNSGINIYRHPFPQELEPLLTEWLNTWRPLRLPAQGSPLVFLTEDRHPWVTGSLNEIFKRTVHRYTGYRTTIHMVRDSFATEYLDATGDVAGAADKLTQVATYKQSML
jgi:hypothetical protein